MNSKHQTTSSTALFGRPERPIKYVPPVVLPDGSIGFDCPLENYFDTSMAPRLLPSHPPGKLYDTVARAHDHRFQVSMDPDPSATVSRPLLLYQPERPRSLAKLSENSPDYMGISPYSPEWRPRRSSYEDLRGSVGVVPINVNTLVPPKIPLTDPGWSPELQQFLDWIPKPALVKPPTPIPAVTPEVIEDDWNFDYDSDSSCEVRVIAPPRVPTPPPQPKESDSETDPYDWSSDSTDSDSDVDHEYNFQPRSPSERNKWLIPRRRPSVEIVKNQDVPTGVTPPLNKGPPRKRRRGGRTASKKVTKTPKRNANDTPARRISKDANVCDVEPEQGSSRKHTPPAQASSIECDTATSLNPPAPTITATTMDMTHVRIESETASPSVGPQPDTPSLKPTKTFPCLLDGCPKVCTSTGDLLRHQQSLRHGPPSFPCVKCGKSYTRADALKRHLSTKISCKRLNTPKPGGGNAEGEPTQSEANTEAL